MVLDGLVVADDPATWTDLGFAVEHDVLSLGGVHIQLAGATAGRGILGWHVDGLASSVLPVVPAPPPGPAGHPNGVLAVDHVVAVSGDLAATTTALAADGLEPRRVRDAGGGRRQAFYLLGTALLELAGPVEGLDRVGFWGLTVVCADLDALVGRLGDRLGDVKAAVQPGRRIATLRREAGSSVPLAFITPR
jgi:hypothetical protein